MTHLLLVLLSFFIDQFTIAGSEQYQLKGTFLQEAGAKKEIHFALNWGEENGIATGVYEDDFYTDKALMKGISGKLGRVFIVTLPKEIKGVRTISLLSSDLKGNKGSALIPVALVLRDDKGNPTFTKSLEANLVGMSYTLLAQRQEMEKCRDGFGELAGYCGFYSGMISEKEDAQNKCDLLSFKKTKLVFDENGEIGLALGELSEIISVPIHRIGRIFFSPASKRINLLSRTCRKLDGTSFRTDECKRLSLDGNFSDLGPTKHFQGMYTITSEKTNEFCRYSLSVDLEI